MIEILNGKILEIDADKAVIECGGVGFGIYMTKRGIRDIQLNSDHKVFTHMIVREDGIELYGFIDRNERECFRLLITVSGVGAKVAAAILSELSPDELASSILIGDKANITRAKGVGPKAAERIIVDLKDKFKRTGLGCVDTNQVSSTIVQGAANKIAQATDALMSLGLTQHESKRLLSKLDIDSMSIEDIVKKALKEFL